MRLFVAVVVVGALGCCMGGEKEAAVAPAPPPAAPSALSQALGEMGVAADPNATGVATTPGAAAADPSQAAPAAAPTTAAPTAAAPPPEAALAPTAVPTTAAPPTAAAPASTAAAPASTAAATPACADAKAARDTVRADVAQLRLTLGVATSARLEAAGAAMAACTRDPACVQDGRKRIASIEAYDKAKAAHEGETRRLAEAEVGLYQADQAVAAACGAL